MVKHLPSKQRVVGLNLTRPAFFLKTAHVSSLARVTFKASNFCVHMCVCVYMCLHTPACVYICVCVCLCMCVCVYACVHAYVHACVRACVHARVCVCACMCVHVHVHGVREDLYRSNNTALYCSYT